MPIFAIHKSFWLSELWSHTACIIWHLQFYEIFLFSYWFEYLLIHRKILDSWKWKCDSKKNFAIMYYSFCIGNVPIFWREKCNLRRKASTHFKTLNLTQLHPSNIYLREEEKKKLYYILQIFLKTQQKSLWHNLFFRWLQPQKICIYSWMSWLCNYWCYARI